MHQLMAFLNTGFTGAFGPLWTAMEMQQPEPDYQSALRRYGTASVVERHEKLESIVGNGPYLVGDRPTLADAILIGVARWLDFHEVARPDRWPRLESIRKRLEADPAVRFALSIEGGDRPEGTGACQGHVGLGEVIREYGGPLFL